MKHNCTAHYHNMILLCFDSHHYPRFFLFDSLHSSPPINILFMPCLLQKFLPHHVCEHLTQHISLLLMGTWCAGELQYYTLQSRQFRLQWLLQTRCPTQRHRNAPPLVQAVQERHCSPYSEVTRTRLHLTQPEWACLKDIFTGIFKPDCCRFVRSN